MTPKRGAGFKPAPLFGVQNECSLHRRAAVRCNHSTRHSEWIDVAAIGRTARDNREVSPGPDGLGTLGAREAKRGRSLRVLVLWADEKSANMGVRALGAGTAALLGRVFPRADFTFLNYGTRTAPVSLDWRNLVRQLHPRSELARWLSQFDLVVDSRSGDSFTDIYGFARLATMSILAEVVSLSRVPLVLGPQTLGPFHTVHARALARRAMGRASLVMARDSASARCAEELGHPAHVLTTDVVFAIPRSAAAVEHDVVVNVSGLLWNDNPHVDSAEYADVVVDLCRRLIGDGRRVTLLAHVIDSPAADNDVPAIHQAWDRIGDEAVRIVVPESLRDVRSVLASARVMVGSRMHACLNALSCGTPAIPLAYSRKFAPLLSDLGWGHTVDLRESDNPAGEVLTEVDKDMSRSVALLGERAQELLGLAEASLRSLR